jgi:hypothetical protein
LAGKVLHGIDQEADDEEVLGRIASAVSPWDPDIQETRALYEGDSELKVPSSVLSLSPSGMGPREVLLL